MSATLHIYLMILWNHSTESLNIIRETHEVPPTLIIQAIESYGLPEINLH